MAYTVTVTYIRRVLDQSRFWWETCSCSTGHHHKNLDLVVRNIFSPDVLTFRQNSCLEGKHFHYYILSPVSSFHSSAAFGVFLPKLFVLDFLTPDANGIFFSCSFSPRPRQQQSRTLWEKYDYADCNKLCSPVVFAERWPRRFTLWKLLAANKIGANSRGYC